MQAKNLKIRVSWTDWFSWTDDNPPEQSIASEQYYPSELVLKQETFAWVEQLREKYDVGFGMGSNSGFMQIMLHDDTDNPSDVARTILNKVVDYLDDKTD